MLHKSFSPHYKQYIYDLNDCELAIIHYFLMHENNTNLRMVLLECNFTIFLFFFFCNSTKLSLFLLT